MAKKLQLKRLGWLAALVVFAFAGLGFRLVVLQVIQHDVLAKKVEGQTSLRLFLEPRRGDILDVRGNLLATSVPVKKICADTILIGSRAPEVARALSGLLQIPENELLPKLQSKVDATGRVLTNRHSILKAKVPLETWEKVQAAMASLSFGIDESKLPRTERDSLKELRKIAVFAEDGQLRNYPNHKMAAHVLGFATASDIKAENRYVSELSGQEGIELTLDKKLSGVRGFRSGEKDHASRELITFRDQDIAAQDGLDVVLTLDSVVQNMVESALAEAVEQFSPVSISGLVIRPRTGEILALATLPNFDPNNPGAVDFDARRNRVISDVAEPGSVFKIVVVSGALNDKTVSLGDIFDCEHGHFAFGGRILHDHVPYDLLSVEQIITKSSNIGAAKVGIKMGRERLSEFIHDFGFGAHTGIPLPGESGGLSGGLVSSNWSGVSIAQIPMGQGIAVTRLQMTMAMCAIANKGALMHPMIVDRLEDHEHKVVARFAPQRVRQVISEAAAREMVQALKTVVGPEGTAPKAALEHYEVAGKTGTAQKSAHGKYVPGKYFSSFVGFFPADNPEICISITMDEPDVRKGYFGGSAAAPVFKRIAEQAANYLNIHPDKTTEAAAQTESRTYAAPRTAAQ